MPSTWPGAHVRDVTSFLSGHSLVQDTSSGRVGAMAKCSQSSPREDENQARGRAICRGARTAKRGSEPKSFFLMPKINTKVSDGPAPSLGPLRRRARSNPARACVHLTRPRSAHL